MKRMSIRRIAQAKIASRRWAPSPRGHSLWLRPAGRGGIVCSDSGRRVVPAGYGEHGTGFSRQRDGQYGLFQAWSAHHFALLLG